MNAGLETRVATSSILAEPLVSGHRPLGPGSGLRLAGTGDRIVAPSAEISVGHGDDGAGPGVAACVRTRAFS